MNKEYRTKWPTDIFSAFSKDKTLAVAAALTETTGTSKEEEKKAVSPLKIYNPDYSVFKVTIIDKGKDVTASANIKVNEIAEIIKRTDGARLIDMYMSRPAVKESMQTTKWTAKKLLAVESLIKNASSGILFFLQNHRLPVQNGNVSGQQVDPAVTENKKKAMSAKFFVKRFSGMTPYDVLVSDGKYAENAAALTAQKNFLLENISKYPANRNLVDCIDAALCLYDQTTGNLRPGAAPAAGGTAAPSAEQESIVLYDSGPKGGYKKDAASGLYYVSDMRIFWNSGNDYPVFFSIRNYKAPIQVYDDGRQNILTGSMDKNSLVETTFRLQAKDWSHCLFMMDETMRRFSGIHAAEQFKQARSIAIQNREESEREKAGKQTAPGQQGGWQPSQSQPQPGYPQGYHYQQAPQGYYQNAYH